MTWFAWPTPWVDTNSGRDIVCEDILVTPPSVEPLDLDEVKKQRRFSSTSLDTRFDMQISAARQQFEEETGLQLITATRMFLMDCFPMQRQISFWRAPVQRIVSVVYGPTGGSPESEMDPADYEVFPATLTAGPFPNPGGVQLVEGASWPTAEDRSGSVRILYEAGFGDAPGAVPELIHYALMMYVGDFHKYAENQTEKATSVLPIGSQMVRRQASMMMTPTRRLTRW